MKKHPICLYFFVVLLTQSCAKTADKTIKKPVTISFSEELVVNGVQNPWGMAFPSKNSILITEKSGKLLFSKMEKRLE